MYAIVETGGRQARVRQGDVIRVELRAQNNPGDRVELPVLLVGEGADVKVGMPHVDGARVEAEVVSHGKHRKVLYFRRKGRDRSRRQGHRQQFTELRITEIQG